VALFTSENGAVSARSIDPPVSPEPAQPGFTVEPTIVQQRRSVGSV
jgi:hypothetical protein